MTAGALRPHAMGLAPAWSTSALATDHPDVATTYNNLGVVFKYKGDCDAAGEYYGKALAIRLRALGADHPLTAGGYYNVGGAYAQKGDADAAPPGHRRFKRDNVHEWAFGSDVLGCVLVIRFVCPPPQSRAKNRERGREMEREI